MKIGNLAAIAAVGVLLCGCAGSVTAPVVVHSLPPEQQRSLAIADVSGEAAPGVIMLQPDIDRITQTIKLELGNAKPSLLAAPGAPADSTIKLKIVFTRYDSGSAFGRAMLIGLGQIHLEGDVLFINARGDTVGSYKIVKQFALGGIAGAVTTMHDVEGGFESSVVDLVQRTRK
jgi:Domain of unknown function (DUF4410)